MRERTLDEDSDGGSYSRVITGVPLFQSQLDRTYISAVERGKRNITISVLARLVKALKVRPTELIQPPPKRR